MPETSLFPPDSPEFFYYTRLLEELIKEIEFLGDIYTNRSTPRQNISGKFEKYFSALLGQIPMVGGYAKAIEQAVFGLIKAAKEQKEKTQRESFLATIYSRKRNPGQRDLFLSNIARHITYRWSFWLNVLKTQSVSPFQENINLFATIGALRLVRSWVIDNIDIEDVDEMLMGVIKGISGAGRDGVRNHPLELKDYKGATVEGAYTRSAYVALDEKTFDKHFYIKSKPTRSVRDSQCSYVKFSVDDPDPNKKVPKYGYVQMPFSKRIKEDGYRRHSPDLKKKDTPAGEAHTLLWQYVSIVDIQKYLAECRNLKPNKRISFNEWLGRRCGKEKITAIFSGIINEKDLKDKNVDFSHGDFSETDFSGTTFIDCTLGKLNKALLLGCTFNGVTATAKVLQFAVANGSTFSGCYFNKLSLFKFQLNYARVETTDFSEIPNHVGYTTLETYFDEPSTMSFPDEKLRKQAEIATQAFNDLEKALSIRMNEADNRQRQQLTEHAEHIESKLKHAERKAEEAEAKFEDIGAFILKERELNQKERAEQAINNSKVEKELREFREFIKDQLLKSPMAGSDQKLILRDAPEDDDKEEEILTEEQVAALNPVHLIDRSGQHGAHGLNGNNPGQSGGPGGEGYPAGHVKRLLKVNQRTGVVQVIDNSAAVIQKDYLPLYNKSSKLEIVARGGNGGWGGNGYIGADGRQGPPGQPATRGTYAEDGRQGEGGQPGGHGGVGGNAGRGGDVTIEVSHPKDSDALMLLKIDNSAGIAGRGGNGSAGGRGGAGGEGGAGYSWVEYEYYTDSNGNSQSREIRGSRPHGQPGKEGAPGASGNPGSPGNQAHKGKIFFIVKEKLYNSRYNLRIEATQRIMSDDDVIEPEERLEVKNIIIQNCGGMPLPAQPVEFSIIGSPFVYPTEQRIRINEPILPDKKRILPKSLSFKVAAIEWAVPNNHALFQPVYVQYNAEMVRVAKDFEKVREYASRFNIRYPLILSPIVAPNPIITTSGECPIAIKLVNLSSKVLGSEALLQQEGRLQGREVYLSIQLEEELPEGAIFFQPREDKSDDRNKMVDLSQPTKLNVPRLSSDKACFLSGSLKVDPSKVNEYAYYDMSIKLWLESNSNHESLEVIQKMTFRLQLSPSYQFDPLSDFVLVINPYISQEAVTSWCRFAATLGATAGIWNSALYGGYSYEQRRFDGGSFYTQLNDKVVVVFDNTYISTQGKVVCSTFSVTPEQIYTAARYANISTYIISANPPDLLSMVVTAPVSESRKLVRYAESKEARHSLAENLSFIDTPKNLYKVLEGHKNPYSVTAPPYAMTPLYQLAQAEEKKVIDSSYAKPYAIASRKTSMCSCLASMCSCLASMCSCLGGSHLLSKATLNGKAVEISRELQKRFPDRQYAVIPVHFVEEEDGGVCSKTYSIGRIEIRQGLDPTTSKIGYRQTTMFARITEADKFNIIKLLPFRKKLDYIAKTLEEDATSTILLKAIVSDLIDELTVFLGSKLSKEEIKLRSAKLYDLLTFKFEDFLIEENPNVKKFISDLLIQVELVADKKRPRDNASKVVIDCIKLVKEKYHFDEKEFRATRKKYKNSFNMRGDNALRSKMLLKFHSRPGVISENSPYGPTYFNNDSKQVKIARAVTGIEKKIEQKAMREEPQFQFSESHCSFFSYGSERHKRLQEIRGQSTLPPVSFLARKEAIDYCEEQSDINRTRLIGMRPKAPIGE